MRAGARLWLPLMALLLCLPGVPARAQPAVAVGAWMPAAPMGTARAGHTATALPGGSVLVAGGFTGEGPSAASSAEVYDPVRDTWTPTGSMAASRAGHVAVALPGGDVLVLGGWSDDEPVPTAERFNPATGAWTTVASPLCPREAFAAVLVGGKVLITGGYHRPSGTVLATTELFDPATGTWSAGPPMGAPRYLHQATPLPDGRVLVAGGVGSGEQGGLDSTEVFDPVSGAWTPSAPLQTARETDDICCHLQAGAGDGTVLAAGGYHDGILASAERFNPAAGTWSPAAQMTTPREGGHTGSLLDGGLLVVVGGLGDDGALRSAEAYDPATGEWAELPKPGAAHSAHTATVLTTESVLVVGGFDQNGVPQAAAEIFQLCPRPSALRDGSFEPGADVPAVEGTEYVSAPPTALGGWNVTAGGVDLVGPSGARAADGKQFVDLNGNGAQPGTIRQPVTTTPGHTYTVSFALAGNPNGDPVVKTGTVSFAGAAAQPFSFDVTGRTNEELGWTTIHFKAVSCAKTAALVLTSTTAGEWGPNIDRVTVADTGAPPVRCRQ